MVKRLLIAFLGFVLLLGVVSAWSVDVTQLNEGAIQSDYGEDVESLHYQLTDLNCSNVSDILFSDDGGATNVSKGGCSESGGEILLPNLMSEQGNNTWMIIVKADDNTTSNDSADFWVDSISPVLTHVNPFSDLIYTNLDTFVFQFKLNETNKGDYPSASFSPFLLKIFDPFGANFGGGNLANLSSTEETLSEIKLETIPVGNLGEGNYTWTIFSKDIYPNGTTIREINLTGIIIRDITAPNYSNIENSSNVYDENKVYSFNSTWIDDISWVNESSVLFNFEGSNQVVSRNEDIYSSDISDLAAGSYTYSWNASDMAGNENTPGDLTFIVAKATPNLNWIINTTWNESYGMTTNVSGNASSQIIANCSLSRDNVLVSNPDVQSLGAGEYNYTFDCNESQNYTANSISENLTINKISPEAGMNISSPGSIVYNNSANVSANETNTEDGNCIYKLYFLNGTEIAGNLDNAVYDIGTIDYIYNTSGCDNYTAGSVNGTLEITKAHQNVSLNFSSQEVNYTESFNVTCNGNLSRNGTFIGKNATFLQTLGAGFYEYNCSLDGSGNYEYNDTINYTLVNKIASSVTLYLNGNNSNLSVAYQELYLIEGNVSIGEVNATLYNNNNPLVAPLTRNGLNVSKQDLDLAGTYNITVVHPASQNYTASSDTLFVTVANRPLSPSSGGSSCKTIYNCTQWTSWSVCVNDIQFRTCLVTGRVTCETGKTIAEIDAGENRTCLPYIVQEVVELPAEEQEGEPIVVEEPEVEQRGLFFRMTGAAVGFAKSGTGFITILTVLALGGAYGFVHYKRRSG